IVRQAGIRVQDNQIQIVRRESVSDQQGCQARNKQNQPGHPNSQSETGSSSQQKTVQKGNTAFVRSRRRWLEEGEQNLAYFFRLENLGLKTYAVTNVTTVP
ncbi:hypothetical protein PO909_023828, partial [Leuciscus waleckii]